MYFVASLRKGVFQLNMLLSSSCITIFDFDKVNIPARKVQPVHVTLMAIMRSSW